MIRTHSGTDGELLLDGAQETSEAATVYPVSRWTLTVDEQTTKPSDWRLDAELVDPGGMHAGLIAGEGLRAVLREHGTKRVFSGKVVMGRGTIGSRRPSSRVALMGNGPLDESDG